MQLSVQLYTLRTPMSCEPRQTLSRISDFFGLVELAGTYGMAPAEFRRLLDEVGLKASASHVGLDALEGDVGQLAEDHRALGCETVILPWVGRDDYADGWVAFADRLSAVAERLHAEGLQFAYHNHDFEFVDNGLRTLFEQASERVMAQLDVAWVRHAGHAPGEWIRWLGPRLHSLHLKDTMGQAGHVDVIAGEGVVDWGEIFTAARDAGVTLGVVELDNPPSDPVVCVERSAVFYRSNLMALG